jgi:hypothetical protein
VECGKQCGDIDMIVDAAKDMPQTEFLRHLCGFFECASSRKTEPDSATGTESVHQLLSDAGKMFDVMSANDRAG